MFLLWMMFITYFLLIGNYSAVNVINYIILVISCIFHIIVQPWT